MNKIIDFEGFRQVLGKVLSRFDGSKGGRPPYDPVLIFKILIMQSLDGLSDECAEFLIMDRLNYILFLGLGLGIKRLT